ncbi:hypothetical protein QBC35DRAFT_465879 [Podospora australis]|uniref:Heterokaryon incompatibility domain-containing protein n=1 Tax=Podospora australis TaxID=1536484 RepID=A0AAN6WMZ7_9PEZI|nr:hypothetical protein QBC35DRAFT_465879 [Podospora australis]
MEFLGRPENPSRPLPRTTYFCCTEDRWDRGNFVTYAARQAHSALVPLNLRPKSQPDPKIPYHNPGLVSADTIPLDIYHQLYTTWLYFGLLSEFLGVNEAHDGITLQGEDEALAEQFLEAIYTEFITEPSTDSATDHIRYIKGDAVLAVMGFVETALDYHHNKERLSSPARLHHLAECLRLVSGMLNVTPEGFDVSLKLSIATLGETLSMLVHLSKSYRSLTNDRPWVNFAWKGNKFWADGTPVREHMVANGWCKSDLSRANTLYSRLQTVYYLSLLDRKIPGRNHDNCDETRCVAGQIDNATYKLSHDPAMADICECGEMAVDIAAVNRVLEDAELSTFPVLRVSGWEDGYERVQMEVEACTEGVEYIAISHVWADGLGNTKGNTLHRCQIARLGRLLHAVEEDVRARDPEEKDIKYRLWIDTLCVPVAPKDTDEDPLPEVMAERRRIYHLALGRMAEVYQSAAHVLVLDQTLSFFPAEDVHPATALLRIFASSQWMRRLWCLQEGVFAQSLYFQFADKPVHAESLFTELELAGLKDARCRHIAADLAHEFRRLSNPHLQARPRGPDFLETIQSSLSYRAVTVPSDEPLCIATLFGLSIPTILSVSSVEDRMALLWKLLEAETNTIPSLVIFRADRTLPEPGLGWAPLSLLTQGDNNAMFTGYTDFSYVKDDSTELLSAPIPRSKMTPAGLEVLLPGMILTPAISFSGHDDGEHNERDMAHAWDGLISGNGEPTIYFHDEDNNWFKLSDWYAVFGTEHGGPRVPLSNIISTPSSSSFSKDLSFCKTLDQCPQLGLIRSEDTTRMSGSLWLLVQILDSAPLSTCSSSESRNDTRREKKKIHCRWLRKVILTLLSTSPPEELVAKTLYSISRAVTTSFEGRRLTNEFYSLSHRVNGSNNTEKEVEEGKEEEFSATKEKLRTEIKTASTKAWEETPWFAEAVEATMGAGMEGYIWAGVVMRFPHDRLARKVAEGEVIWVVD